MNLTLGQGIFLNILEEIKMEYSIGEVSKMFSIPVSTLRYYDKKGLLPMVDRTSGNIRVFDDNDIEYLSMIECLKTTGLSLKSIRNTSSGAMRAIQPSTSGLNSSRNRKGLPKNGLPSFSRSWKSWTTNALTTGPPRNGEPPNHLNSVK